MEIDALPYAFTRQQSLAFGLSDFRRQRLVSKGQLVRTRRGLYVRASTPQPEQRAAAYLDLARAMLSEYGEGFALCHVTAAAAHGVPLPLGPLGTVHLVDPSPPAQTRRAPGGWVHGATSLPVGAVAIVAPTTTSVATTVADCLRLFGAR